MTSNKQVAVFFGGFRQSQEDEEEIAKTKNAFSSFVTDRGCATRYVFKEAWANLPSPDEYRDFDRVHIVSYSLGCHAAIRFAASLPKEKLGEIHLLAPDPKCRMTKLDQEEENEKPSSSAFKFAEEFWAPEPPGNALESGLQTVAKKARLIQIRYSVSDSIAEWPTNVEFLQTRLPPSEKLQWLLSDFHTHTDIFWKTRLP